MLASPLYPAPPFPSQLLSDDPAQVKPSKDIDAFNSLLPPPIEFVEGSSSGVLAVAEGKYDPINGTPKASKVHSLKLVVVESPEQLLGLFGTAEKPIYPATHFFKDFSSDALVQRDT